MKFRPVEKVILLGGGSLLIRVAEMLRNRYPILIVTSPRHDSERISMPDGELLLSEYIENAGMEKLVVERLSDAESASLGINDGTLAFSIGAAWIFKQPFIDLFRGQLLNFHGARLPQERGGGGFSWRIMRGDRQGYSLIHQVECGIDDGDIVLCNLYTFPSGCRTPQDYMQYSNEKYLETIDSFLKMVEEGKEFKLFRQQEHFSTYWPRLNTGINGFINWAWKDDEIERFILAFDEPFAGASTYISGKLVRLKSPHLSVIDGGFHPFQCGLVFRVDSLGCHVALRDGSLIVGRVLGEDGKDCLGEISPGDRFITPMEKLEKALAYRPIYTPQGLKS